MSHDKIRATFVKFWQQLRPQSTIHDLSLGLRPRSPNCPTRWSKSRTFWAITRTGTSLCIGCVHCPEPRPVLAQVLFDFINWDWSQPCPVRCPVPRPVSALVPFDFQDQDGSWPQSRLLSRTKTCLSLVFFLFGDQSRSSSMSRTEIGPVKNWYLFNMSRYQIPQIGKIGLIDYCQLF